MEIHQYIKNIKSQLKKIDQKRKKNGSSYGLIVERSNLTFDVLNIVFEARDTPFYDEARNVNKFAGQLHRKLEAEISLKDLKILAYHGNTDADWILAQRLRDAHSKKWSTYSTAKKQKAYKEFIGHLENGAFVYLTSNSAGLRMMEVAEQHLSGRFIYNLEAGLTYLLLALDEPDTVGEAAFGLWNVYFDEIGDKETALQYLLISVDANYPEALAAYGRAHWGDWLVEEDEKKAFKLLKRSAELGSGWGTELLATSYSLGLGIRKNASKAFELRQTLSENYSGEVCRQLACHYLEGEGIKKDFDEGLRLLQKAMKMGDGKAHWEMANLLEHGDEIEKNSVERFKVLKKSVALDEPYSLTFNKLAACYFYGKGTKQDFEKARDIYTQLLEVGSIESQVIQAEWHLEALDYHDPVEAIDFVINKSCAADGDAQHQYDLGVHYYEGKIIPRDDKEAVKWFKFAAKQDHPNAQAMLGEMYFNGHGIRKSYKEALKWYHLASQMGEASSNHNLGFMYETGLGVDRDNEKAFEFYAIAAKHGIALSQNRLGAAHEVGEVLSQDYKLAVKWYRLAANQGDPMGQNNLGVMYDQGFGVRKSIKKAFELYQLSAKQDYSPAQTRLGVMYQYGEGVPKSSQKAIEWYRRAAKRGHHKAQYNLGFFYKDGDHLGQSNLNAYVCFHLAQGDGSGWSKELSTRYLNISCEQVEHANEEILELEKSMKKSEISEAKALAEKCITSAYQTWIW